jgi:predicted O-linked N-acetylglucosamine transferase (SPINDLY family)
MPPLTIKQAFNLALQHHKSGRLREAENLYKQILGFDPTHSGATHYLGVIAHDRGNNELAVDLIRKAIAMGPDLAEAHNNLALALQDLGRLDEAIASYQYALTLKPNFPGALFNLGIALQRQGKLDESIAACRQSIALQPSDPTALYNLASSLIGRGEIDEAIAVCRQSVAIRTVPDNSDGYRNLLYALYHHPDSDAHKLLDETREWGKRQQLFAPFDFARQDATPDRTLRIGYLSPFFFGSPDIHFILPLLANHDRSQFEICCYTATANRDRTTELLKTHCDQWFDVCRLNVAESVDLIRSHQVDVLITMSPPADPCWKIIASRVAPVQATWLTFASCTTGVSTADYRISDPFIDPPDQPASSYAEQTLRLPDTAWCYDPLSQIAPAKSSPAPAPGNVTFGSFNRFSKINAEVIATWAEILRSLPQSRLQIMAPLGSARQTLFEQFERLGVERNRIGIVERLPREQYLRQYDSVDVMLDPFPFSGHTTVFDSSWMGVPLVTRFGQTSVGRVAAAALMHLGLGELIARTPGEYVRIAVALANDLPRLKNLRAVLRPRMIASPLMDGRTFARNMEACYREMWRKWCRKSAV